MDREESRYRGAETTGFQSPAQDYITEAVDLARVLDLRRPGRYPLRVTGQSLAARGIRDGDILIADAAADPVHGGVAIAILQGSLCLALLERRAGSWYVVPAGRPAVPVSEDVEIWAIVAGLVRETV